MTRIGLGLGTALFVAAAVAGCGGSSAYDEEVTVKSSDELRFLPDIVEVSVGDRVRPVTDNSESLGLHDFTIRATPVSDISVEE